MRNIRIHYGYVDGGYTYNSDFVLSSAGGATYTVTDDTPDVSVRDMIVE
jgi:hypothetical protein